MGSSAGVAEPTLTAAAALDAIEEGVMVHNADQVVYANRAAGELLGVELDELRGAELAPPCECVSESGTPLRADEWPVVGALRSGRPQRPRVLGVRHPNGGVRWLRVSARPFGSSVLTSLLDVTALRQAEEDAAALAARLDGSVTGVLSPREHQVVELLAAGLTGDEVADRLGISPATVRVHIRNATGKLGASTRTQAVAIAVARGEVAAP
jgi:DNA-binding CsgD family transcriptional regulator